MCEGCDSDVAKVGEHLDQLLAAERALRSAMQGLSTQQHTVRLTTDMLELFAKSENKTRCLSEFTIGFATAITRLLALEEVCGLTP